MNIARIIHKDLNDAINTVVDSKELYVKQPAKDFTRKRKLTFRDTIELILSMEGGSLKKEIHEFCSIRKNSLTASAFIQQRSKISSRAFEDIFRRFNSLSDDKRTFKGYKVFAVDGSDINHFRNPNLDSFVTNSNVPAGYNLTHLNALYDIHNKTFKDAVLVPRPKCNEQAALIELLQRNSFDGKNIIIADRGYEGYNVLAHFLRKENVDFLCRLRHGKGAMKETQQLPFSESDIDVCIEITNTQTNEDKEKKRRYLPTTSNKKEVYSPNTKIRRWDFPSPYILRFRIIRIQLETGEYETLATSLGRDEFSINDIKELYHQRWGVETAFRDLKYPIGLINFHCKKEDLVMQEIYASLIMYNYCSRIAGRTSVPKKHKTVYKYKVNFTMAVHLCITFFKSKSSRFIQLIKDIGKYTEPIRPGRKDERNLRIKGFISFTYRVAA